jgi:mRNA interferase RelE/StbE
MRGYHYWRVDIGEYRIIYEVEGNTLCIILIGKRNDDEVYKKLRRK